MCLSAIHEAGTALLYLFPWDAATGRKALTDKANRGSYELDIPELDLREPEKSPRKRNPSCLA